MKQVNEILKHPYYRECVRKIEEMEAEREFCRHDMTHFLDVARIAALLNAGEQTEVPKKLIYAAALLHDIGRHEQYKNGTPHHEAGADIAGVILSDCGFSAEESAAVLGAILAHRSTEQKENALADLIYRADKLSRPCFCCPAEEKCNWSAEKKNMILKY